MTEHRYPPLSTLSTLSSTLRDGLGSLLGVEKVRHNDADVARIRVDSFDDERGRWYRVTDNGAGFDMRRARGLFQPFRRMHPSSQFEGSGVGLSLVQRIVQHHGGEVRLRSQEGVGTVAEFTLDPAPGTAPQSAPQ